MGAKHWVVTVACWAFLAVVLGAFVWFNITTLWACLARVCSDSDAGAVGGVLGLVLLLGLPALVRRIRRAR